MKDRGDMLKSDTAQRQPILTGSSKPIWRRVLFGKITLTPFFYWPFRLFTIVALAAPTRFLLMVCGIFIMWVTWAYWLPQPLRMIQTDIAAVSRPSKIRLSPNGQFAIMREAMEGPANGEPQEIVVGLRDGQAVFSANGSVTFSPDSSWVYTQTCEGAVEVFDTAHWRLRVRIPTQNQPSFRVFCRARDQRLLVWYPDDQRIEIWDVANGVRLDVLNGFGRPDAFSNDGRMVIVGAGRSRPGVAAWDVDVKKVSRLLDFDAELYFHSAFSPDNKRFVVVEDPLYSKEATQFHVWQCAGLEKVCSWTDPVQREPFFQFDPTSHYLFTWKTYFRATGFWDMAAVPPNDLSDRFADCQTPSLFSGDGQKLLTINGQNRTWQLMATDDLKVVGQGKLVVHCDRESATAGHWASLPTDYLPLRDHPLNEFVSWICDEILQFSYPCWGTTIMDLSDGQITNSIPVSAVCGFDELTESVWTEGLGSEKDWKQRTYTLSQWSLHGAPKRPWLPTIGTMAAVALIAFDARRGIRKRKYRLRAFG